MSVIKHATEVHVHTYTPSSVSTARNLFVMAISATLRGRPFASAVTVVIPIVDPVPAWAQTERCDGKGERLVQMS
jgi:hypothetical protein